MFKKLFGSKSNYKFKEQKDTACFTCNHILDDKQEILYVSHDNDSSWQFLCGNNNHSEEDARIVSIEQITKIDTTVNYLYEMPNGICAERKNKGDKWKPYKLQ